MTNPDYRPIIRSRIDGAVLVGSACLAVFAMMHHPHVVAHNAHDALGEISDKSDVDRIVHGVLMLLLSLQTIAYVGIASRLGWSRISTQYGAIAYSVGFLFTLHAALIDGFVIPDLVSVQTSSSGSEQGTVSVLNLCIAVIHMSTAVGLVAMSLGLSVWSATLLGKPRHQRFLGIVGIVLNGSVAFAIVFGILHLDLHGALTLILLQSLWNVIAGTSAWRGVL